MDLKISVVKYQFAGYQRLLMSIVICCYSLAANALQMDDAIASLQARLAESPNDIGGWKMLGRSQASLNNFAAAADAYR